MLNASSQSPDSPQPLGSNFLAFARNPLSLFPCPLVLKISHLYPHSFQ
jgi:hypothetical protein